MPFQGLNMLFKLGDMKKKSFVLSWGRKMFFGLGWALTSIVALNYFQSMIIPQTFTGWMYFITTFIGHYGAMISLLYFLIYCPIVMIFPSYYVSRFTSILLLICTNLFIFFDSYVFTRYRYHADSFLWNFAKEVSDPAIFGLTSMKLVLIGFVTLLAFIILWIQSERVWRYMQTRFSNPVKNWYLIVILICLCISQSMSIVGEAKGNRKFNRISNLFPLHMNLPLAQMLRDKGMVDQVNPLEPQGYKDFYYPRDKMNCQIKGPKNVLMIVMDKWNSSEFNEILTPNIAHYATHGLVFKNHFTGGLDSQGGYFSLMYALPASYSVSAINEAKEPVFISVMKQNKMDLTFFESGANSPAKIYLPKEPTNSLEKFESSLSERDDLAEINPFLMSVYLENGSVTEKDAQIKTVVDLFIKHKLIKNTIVIITGAYGDQVKTPMIMIWPDREHEEIQAMTTHYDVVPTIMKENWKCKNPSDDYSIGRNLFSDSEFAIHIAGDYSRFKVVDPTAQTIAIIDETDGVDVRDINTMQPKTDYSAEDILIQLQRITSFYRRP